MKPDRSPERRDLDWQAMIETALTALGRMGDTYNRFYNYSFMNQLLQLKQGVREAGRHILVEGAAGSARGVTMHLNIRFGVAACFGGLAVKATVRFFHP
jgi:hypothetical protein